MKKFTLFILTIFTVATLYAAARPSLDGRAVVADSGTMPRGLFARTVGYLPGDSVTVTNPATGSTVDVLILGAIDPSEGVAILLSPEAADGLRIKPNSNVQVKLTKRSGSLDENANGSAVLSDAEEESASEEPAVAKAPVEETPAAPAPVTPVTPVASSPAPVTVPAPVVAAVPAEEEKEEESVEEIPVIAEKPEAVEETVEETPVVAEAEESVEETPAVAEETVEETPVLAKVEEPVSEEPAEEEIAPDTVYEILPPLPNSELTYGKQKVVVLDGKEPDYIEEIPAVAEETHLDETLAEEAVAPALAEYNDDEEKVSDEVPAVAEETELVEETPAAAEVEEAVAEIPYEIEREPVVTAEAEPEPETDAYQPIVLVPAEPNPPVAENVAAAPVESEPVVETAPVTEVAPKVVVSNEWTNYVVPSVKNLRSGSYYVQVASLGNKENIKNFVDKYSTKYPVVLVQNSSKNAYHVMVGPLNIDEYGAVDEKFKDFGFKDSFVRKIR